jgi:hypothetical protein
LIEIAKIIRKNSTGSQELGYKMGIFPKKNEVKSLDTMYCIGVNTGHDKSISNYCTYLW